MLNYQYNYAQIDMSTNMCIGVHTSSTPVDEGTPNWIEIPAYDDVFVFKYYNFDNPKWYNDSAMTDEFIYEG